MKPELLASVREKKAELESLRPLSAAALDLLLIIGGYPPVAVRPEDRKAYLDALEHGSLHGDLDPFQSFMHTRLETTLAEYVDALK